MLAPDDLDAVWEELALAVDRAGPARDRLMLAKLALLFAEALGDAPRATALIRSATEDLQ